MRLGLPLPRVSKYLSQLITLLILINSHRAIEAQTSINIPAPAAVNFSSQVPTFGAGHDYIQTFAETVNPANGSVSLRIPIVVPKGRGLTPDLAINYDSASVNSIMPTLTPGLNAVSVPISIGPGNFTPIVSNAGVTAAGWAAQTPTFQISPNSWTSYDGAAICSYTQGYVFTDSLGQPHAFPDLTFDDASGVESYRCPALTAKHVSTSLDGSVQALIIGGTSPIKVTESNGTTYTFSFAAAVGSPYIATPDLIEDRNGNQINYATGQSDTLGRPAPAFNLTTTNGQLTSASVSVGNVTSGYQLVWDSINSSGIGWNPVAQVTGDSSNQQFNCNISAATGTYNYHAPTSLQLPDGTSYHFYYDPQFSVLNKIVYPNGGYVAYTWGLPGGFSDQAYGYWQIPVAVTNDNNDWTIETRSAGCLIRYSMPVILHREVSYDGSTVAQTQDFSYSTTFPSSGIQWSSKTTTVNTTDHVTGLAYSTVYNYVPTSSLSPVPITYGESGNIAIVYSSFQASGLAAVESSVVVKNSSGSILKSTFKTWDSPSRILSETTVLENGQTSETDYSYIGFPIQKLHETDVYDYGSGAKGALLQKTVINYATFGTIPNFPGPDAPSGSFPSLFGFPASRVVYDGANNRLAETDFNYDETNAVDAGATNHDEVNYAAGSTVPRANATSISNKCFIPANTSQVCADTTTTMGYDKSGQVVSLKDPAGSITTFSYADSFSPGTGTAPGSTNAFLTKITHPTVNGITAYETAKYDYSNSLIVSFTDANNNTSSYCYSTGGCAGSSTDPWFRLTGTRLPDGGSTVATYNDFGTTPSTIVSRSIRNGVNELTASMFDGMGHLLSTQLMSDPSGTVNTDLTYDGEGHVYKRSNPYRAGDSIYQTTYTYDALDRMTYQTQPDSSVKQWSYNGSAMTSTDEAGSSWTRSYNAFGDVIAVVEPLGSSGQTTSYGYDGLRNLIFAQPGASSTSQGCTESGGLVTCGIGSIQPLLSRSFVYDSLSRLISALNPETGSISYVYQSGGVSCVGDVHLPCAKTDSRGVTTTYSYDALNRIHYKTYNDGTYTAAFGYDGKNEDGSPVQPSVTNAIGRLSHISNEVNAAANFGYDALGRLSSQRNCLPSDCSYSFNITSTYDLAGNMTDLTYPDGRHIQQTWDSMSRLQSSNLVDINGVAASQNYLQSIIYNPDGTPNVTTLGNGVAQQVLENNRLQVSSLSVSNSTAPFSGQSFLSHSYCYLCGTDTTGNNGNIWQISDSQNPAKTQSFSYDSLNRITAFSVGGVLTQQYQIDPFGNMSPVVNSNPIYSFDPSTNRINNLPCAASVTAYDAGGNQLCDSDQYGGVRQYTFDAENRVAGIATFGSTSLFESYIYGADGPRVRKTNANGSFTEYINFNGQPIAEKDQTGSWTDYIYANGKKIARVDTSDMALHFQGTACDGCVSSRTGGYLTSSLNNYSVKAGDKIVWRQFENSATEAGMAFWFWNCSGSGIGGGADSNAFDTDGQTLLNDGIQNQWHQRTFDLTPYAGCQIQTHALGLMTLYGPAKSEAWFADIAIVSTDGGVTPFYHRDTTAPSMTLQYPSSDVSNVSVSVDSTTVPPPTGSTSFTTTYFVGDHLGTAQMEFSSGGWPVWKGEFAPFGQELDTQATANHYKFTGKERDSESGLDYFGARYYASTTGRWMSPDWSAKAQPVPYAKLEDPQSLNLYSYVRSNPLTRFDPDGHKDWCAGSGGGTLACSVQTDWNNAHEIVSKTLQSAATAAAVVGARISPSAARKLWEGANPGQKVSFDAVRGRFFDMAHIKALADGGTNTAENLKPQEHGEHMAEHMAKGDFSRWAAEAKDTIRDAAKEINSSEAVRDIKDAGSEVIHNPGEAIKDGAAAVEEGVQSGELPL